METVQIVCSANTKVVVSQLILVHMLLLVESVGMGRNFLEAGQCFVVS